MKKRPFILFGLSSLFILTNLPTYAQEANKDAKKLGRKGIYGTNTLEEMDKEDQKGEKKPEEMTEQERKLMKQYPLTRTDKLRSNQKAHLLTLEGIKRYHKTRKLFDAINQIKSTYLATDEELSITQSGLIQSRIQPRDLLEYGPEYAYIGLRIRALENEAIKEAKASLNYFRQAKGLVPTSATLDQWIRVTQDTEKALQYHLRFYKVTVKAVKLGLTQEQLQLLAKLWSTNVHGKDVESLTTVIKTAFLKTATDESTGEGISYESLIQSLPNLEFKLP